jgi:hypothetical protein
VAESGTGRLKAHLPRPVEGQRFGQLVVSGFDLGPAGGVRAVRVRCDCGAPEHRVHISNLRNGYSRSCPKCAVKKSGAKRKEWFRYADVVPDDGHRRRLCNRISACVNRCHNPNDAGYRNYGGRGISVHAPWRADRAAFLAYLVTLDGWDQPALELDREDVNKGYEPGNLRFITKRENSKNKRKVGVLEARIAELEARLRSCKCGTA